MLPFRNFLVQVRPYVFFVLLLVLCTLPAFTVLAQVTANPGNPDVSGSGSGLTNPLHGTNTLTDLLNKVLDAVIAIGTVVVTIMLVYCGFLFVVARGNEEKIRDARTALVWTVIGALILLGAKVISGIISSTVNTL